MTESVATDERYASATHAGNLKLLDGEKIGNAEVLAAAGMSPRRLGAALIRLHSEYDGAARKRGPMTESDLRILHGQLRSLPEVKAAVAQQARWWGLEDADKVAAAVLFVWVAGYGYSTDKRGHGRTVALATPYGESGKRVHAFLDDCKSRAVASIRARLR